MINFCVDHGSTEIIMEAKAMHLLAQEPKETKVEQRHRHPVFCCTPSSELSALRDTYNKKAVQLFSIHWNDHIRFWNTDTSILLSK